MTIQAEKLDKSARDALPEEHFAVPGKRKLPINDERHTRLAWDMVDRTQGLTPEERKSARERILRRAHELGIDTADWHKVKAMSLRAMSLNISNDGDHPNKMPFSGVLTRLDEPSDFAPEGSSGRKIILTRSAAEQALASLLGMAVDFKNAFDGHDVQAKIGIITSANIEGNAIVIEGFIYAADFPEVAATIKATQSVLGFSFEAQRLFVADPAADVLTINELAFTGAAILRKDKAAYQTTSLAASAEEIPMTPDELKAMLGETVAAALAPVTARLDKIENGRVDAHAATMARVEPHAKALESCAAAMEAAGIGLHPENGHVAHLRRMASAMRAEAAVGKIPHIFRDHDYPMSAAAGKSKTEDDMDEKAIKAAIDAAMKPVLDKLAATETQLADMKAAARKDSDAPERKTMPPAINALLAKAGIAMPEGEDKLSLAAVDKALGDTNLNLTQRIMVKNSLQKVGAIA